VTSECTVETTLKQSQPARTRRPIPPHSVTRLQFARPGEAPAATPVVDRSTRVVGKYDVSGTGAPKMWRLGTRDLHGKISAGMPRETAGNTASAGIKLATIPRDGNLIAENAAV